MATRRPSLLITALFVTALGLAAMPARAQLTGQTVPGTQGVGLDQRLGQQLPLDLAFTDDAGRAVRLGDYFGQGKPVLVHLVYYTCPMLCNLLLDGLTTTLRSVPAAPGPDYTIVTVSFEPTETTAQAARQKAKHLQDLGRAGAAEGWHFLTGSPQSIHALAQSIGFRYRWDEKTQQYAHPATILFASPEGVVTRYLPGVTFQPFDVRLALTEASEGRVGTIVDAFLMFCFHYDPTKGGYAVTAMRVMQAGGGLTLLSLGFFLSLLWRRHSTRAPHPTV